MTAQQLKEKKAKELAEMKLKKLEQVGKIILK